MDQHRRDRTGLGVLSRTECLRRLSDEYTGRLAFTDGDGRQVILPCNYRLDRQARIIMRTTAGAKLAAARRRAEAAFEIDHTDETYQTGWSVVLRGRLEEVTRELDIAELERLALQPWARAVERVNWIRLVPEDISGREIVRC